jgi:hypothetical protein
MSWATTAAQLTAGTMATLGNAVTIGAVTNWGILRSPSEMVLDGAVVVTDWMLELPAAVWASITEGQGITVDGANYVARESSRPGTDGSTIHVPLERIDGELPPAPGDSEVVIDGDWL